VVAGTAVVAGKLAAVGAGIKRSDLRAAVFFIELVFADDTHGCPLSTERRVSIPYINNINDE